MTHVDSFTVVAAVIRDSGGYILLTQRPDASHMGGLWEFPGGKVDDGEGPEEALVRELDEELGIGVEIGDPITFAVHREPGLRILLLFYAATISRGEPEPREEQAIVWVPASRLDQYPTPPADARLVRQLMDSDSA
jgi:8-oxo-dGTP diphosphatase